MWKALWGVGNPLGIPYKGNYLYNSIIYCFGDEQQMFPSTCTIAILSYIGTHTHR